MSSSSLACLAAHSLALGACAQQLAPHHCHYRCHYHFLALQQPPPLPRHPPNQQPPTPKQPPAIARSMPRYRRPRCCLPRLHRHWRPWSASSSFGVVSCTPECSRVSCAPVARRDRLRRFERTLCSSVRFLMSNTRTKRSRPQHAKIGLLGCTCTLRIEPAILPL